MKFKVNMEDDTADVEVTANSTTDLLVAYALVSHIILENAKEFVEDIEEFKISMKTIDKFNELGIIEGLLGGYMKW